MAGRWLACLVAVAVVTMGLALSISGGAAPRPPDFTDIVVTGPQRAGGSAPADERGLEIRLGEAEPSRPGESRLRQVTGDPLTAEAIAELFARVPPLEGQAGDRQEFAFPPATLPPPKPGKQVEDAFPPPPRPAPGPVAAGPLEVVQHMPEGEVPLAAELSLTFSAPMVPVSSTEELASRELPVRLVPEVPGQWRWLGTQTLLFRPEKRFAMATRYTAEVSAGVKSMAGAALGEAFAWSFATPAPRLVQSYPRYTNTVLKPLCFVAFDQAIDRQAVLAKTRLTVEGNAGPPLRLATDEEVETHRDVAELAKHTPAERWLAFVPQTELAQSQQVVVHLGPGLPSAEGPLTTDDEQTYDFRTYGPLRVTEHRCAWGENCPPQTPWVIRFSNRLDPAALAQLAGGVIGRIEPAVPHLKVEVQNDALVLQGQTRARTDYRVTLLSEIRDEFGQTLGSDVLLRFSVGPAETQLSAPVGPLVVQDPQSEPKLSVYTSNYAALRVRAFAVEAKDWPAYLTWLQNDPGLQPLAGRARRGGRGRPGGALRGPLNPPPGREVFNRIVQVNGPADQLNETVVRLKEALPQGLGHLVVAIYPEGKVPSPDEPLPLVRTWLQVTRLGLTALADEQQLRAWATSLSDGKPLAGVEFSLEPAGPGAKSAADGVAAIDLPPAEAEPRSLLVARLGDDVALLPKNSRWGWYGGREGWAKRLPGEGILWYVFDDRKLYRPSETVHLKGWLRRIDWAPTGDLSALGAEPSRVRYELRDSQGNEIGQGTAQLTALGGFDCEFQLPANANLGTAQVSLTALATGSERAVSSAGHALEIQEFRRPEYEVTATAASGTVLLGESTTIAAQASYFAGGGLADAEVRWQVSSSPGSFTPPGRDDFSFGTWTPWWRSFDGRQNPTWSQYSARTDAAGRHTLKLDFVSVTPPRPMSVSATASIQDVNRQEWSASSQLLVHPANLYVGLRAGTTFVGEGERLSVTALACDLEGKAVAGRAIELRFARLDWQEVGGSWEEVEVEPQTQQVVSGEEPVAVEFRPAVGGAYRLTALVRDERERPNQSELRLWVSGGKLPARRDVAQEEVELIPNQKQYQPGDTAEVLVRTPFAPAEAVLTISRGGTLRSERLRIEGATHTLRIPIEDSQVPNVWVRVDLVGAATRTDDEGQPLVPAATRPAFASGQLKLEVPPLARRLSVTATPRQPVLRPGAEAEVALAIAGADGRPLAGAEVAVVVVDEAVLALTGYRLVDPLGVFYPERGITLAYDDLRALVQLTRSDQLLPVGGGMQEASAMRGRYAAPTAAPVPEMMAADAQEMRVGLALNSKSGAGGAPPPPIALRSNFDPLAAFVPALRTDADGVAVARFTLPDNLTRYRVMVVAVDEGGRRFGLGESTLTARLPLMVRPSPPRFLNYGDSFELPVVLQNQTTEPMQVALAVRGANLALGQLPGRRVTVPGGDRVEVRFPAQAELPGRARLQVVASSETGADATAVELPVWTPATTEAFATYGEIDEGAIEQIVRAPADVVPQFGGLELSTSSTALSALTDAVIYLTAYPFECAEQISSRVMTIVALRDVLAAFEAEGLPSPEALNERIAADLARLGSMQNQDGGFGFWRAGYQSWPYLSIHAAHALARCRQKDFAVPDELWRRAHDYLVNIHDRIPEDYSPQCRRMLEAYALYVRHLSGDAVALDARALLGQTPVPQWPLEGLGWLMSVMAEEKAGSSRQWAEIGQHLANRATQTAGEAHFVTNYAEQSYLVLGSDRRVDAVLLGALIEADPQNPLVPKLVRGLLAHRTRGHWGNTQENCFVLLALDQYFRKYEGATPDFVAQAWLGPQFAADQRYQGRSTEQHQVSIPLALLGSAGTELPLVLAKEGTGRLYYRLGLRYAPASLELAPADYGFAVERRYVAIDHPDDVSQDADGTWHLKAGASLRVELRFVAPGRRYHVALVDPLPAGLEAVNPALVGVAERPQPLGAASWAEGPMLRGGYWPWWHWHEHQNLRDDRVEAFSSLVYGGVYTYSYEARATTPGRFVVPPTRVEEMYAPETFGRTGTDRVVVE